MPAALVQLTPMILGALVAPVELILVLLLLGSPRGLLKATAFVLGITLGRLLKGAIFGPLFASSPDAAAENGGPSPVVSTLLLLVGLLLLTTSFRVWRQEPDPDDPPPAWMQTITQASPLKALGLGAVVIGINMKMWVFTLSAIGIVSAADLGRRDAVGTFLLYVFLVQIHFILALLACAVAPRATERVLQRLTELLIGYNRPITIVATLIFGLYFTWDGITNLLS